MIKFMENTEIKLTTEEKSELLEINSEFQNVLLDLGQIQVKKNYHEQELKNLANIQTDCNLAYSEVEKKELNFRTRMNKKYGKGNVDVETSTFIKE